MVTKMSVREMSKKVAVWMIVILVILLIADFVRSAINDSSPWLVGYMDEHYSGLFDDLSSFAESAVVSDTEPGGAVCGNFPTFSISEWEPEGDDSYPFDGDGFIFAKSNVEYLSKEEVYALQDMEGYEFKTLLGFARNELYARYGYPFKKSGEYYQLYSQYDWYNEMEHKVVSEEVFNQYEAANLKLIVGIEKAEGFR